jgi:hypothetical protein
MNTRIPTILVLIGAAAMSNAAFAYVGPGAGLTLLGALWGLLLAICAALAFVVMWPLRQWRKRVRAERAAAMASDEHK